MSKKDAKTDNSGNNKNSNWIVTAIIFMLVIAVGVCAGIFGGADKRLPQGEIQVFSYDPRVYYTEGKPQKEFYIKAGIVYKDGTIDDNMQNLSFTTNNAAVKVDPNGQIKVTEEIFGDDADQNAVENVMINIKPKDPSSVYIAKDAEATVTVELRPYPKYNITLDTNVFDGNDGNFTQTVGVWEGADVKVDNAQRTLFDDQEFQTKLRLLDDDNDVDGWKFEGWYMLSVNDQLEDEAFDFTESYYWGKDITLRARYSADLVLDDDMPEVEKDSTLNKVYYNEPLKRQLSLLDTENGWTFAGWFPQQAGEGNQYMTSDQIFAERVPHLYAKWTGKLKFELTLPGSSLDKNEVDIIYGKALEKDDIPEVTYNNDGEFGGWYTRQYGEGDDLNKRSSTCSVGEQTYYDCIKFKITFDFGVADTDTESKVLYCNQELGEDNFFAQSSHEVNYGANIINAIPDIKNCTNLTLSTKWSFNSWTLSDGKQYIEELELSNEEKIDELKYEYTHNLTITANWKSVMTAVPVFKFKNEDVTILYNKPLPLTSLINGIRIIENWKLDGWYFSNDYSDTKLSNEKESAYIGEGAPTIYGKWVTVDKINYVFNDNDNTELQGDQFVYGEQHDLLTKGAVSLTLKKDGYSMPEGFKWYADPTFTNQITSNTSLFPEIFYNLYLKWDPMQFDNITLDANKQGHFSNNQTIKTFTFQNENKIIMGENLPSIENLGIEPNDPKYHLMGFFDKPEGGTQYYLYTDENKLVGCAKYDFKQEAPVTLYAQWMEGAIRVKLDNNYEGEVSTYYLSNGSPMPEVFELKYVTKNAGKVFKGYFGKSGQQYYDSELKSCISWNSSEYEQDLEGDILNLQAKYEDVYTIEIDWHKHGFVSQFSKADQQTQDGYINVLETWKGSANDRQYTSQWKAEATSGTSVKLIMTSNSTGCTNIGIENIQYWDSSSSKWVDSITFKESNFRRKDNYATKDAEFKMPAANVKICLTCFDPQEGGGGGPCVTPDTLITLADGTQKRVEDLKGDEMLLVWNLFTGQFDAAPILFVDSDEKEMFEIINLRFSDGTAVKVIYEHGFWDYDLNEWVFLRSDASKYIGHWFNKQALDGSGNMVNQRVQLVEVELTYEETTAWSPVTFGHLCYYVNGMLSMPGATEGLINIFDVDPETMKFDEEKMAADIEKYGLFTYDDFKDLIPEAVYEAFNGTYLKVAIGKGILTWDMLEALILRYADFWTV